MDWSSHVAIGVICVWVLFYALGIHDALILGMIGVIGGLSALMPDLDHEMSKGKQILDKLVPLFALGIAYLRECNGKICVPNPETVLELIIVVLVIVGIYFLIYRLFKPRHRGITHTLAASFVFGIIVYFFAGFTVSVAAFVGYLSHLIADREIKLI